jgi:hypothetical protein
VNELGKPSMPPAKAVPYRATSPTNGTAHFSRSGNSVAAELRFDASPHLPHRTCLLVRLDAGQPYVDLQWQVVDKPADPWPEAGWLSFPLSVGR